MTKELLKAENNASFPPHLVIKRAQLGNCAFYVDCDLDDEVSEHHVGNYSYEFDDDNDGDEGGLHFTRSSMPRGAPSVRREATRRIKTSLIKTHRPPTHMSPHI